ncbi:hypothetical protein MBLNU230_g7605t1 [Neophaeotheca triangularis]
MTLTNNFNVRSIVVILLGALLPVLFHVYQDKLAFDWPLPTDLSFLFKSTNTGPVHPSDFLLKDLRKIDGSWNTNHPRYRLLDALRAFDKYEDDRLAELAKWRTRYRRLPDEQKKTIEQTLGYSKRLNDAGDLMKKNAEIARSILAFGLESYEVEEAEFHAFTNATAGSATTNFHVQDAMKHFVRDWSLEGLNERQPTFPCILDAVTKAFPRPSRSLESPAKVLVPGAGLGRLGHEIADLGGFNVTINEWSFHMVLAYRWLQTLETPDSVSFHPFIDSWNHRSSVASLTRSVSFPDMARLLSQPSVKLVDGDFTKDLKSDQGSYDALVTLFFLDTAKSLLTYLKTIHAMLKPGGVWINHGPLLYRETLALKLTLEEVVALAEAVGFQFEIPSSQCGREMEGLPFMRGELVPYQSDEERLSRNAYLSQHWVARKV